jgi:hypothetical protein
MYEMEVCTSERNFEVFLTTAAEHMLKSVQSIDWMLHESDIHNKMYILSVHTLT